MKGNLLYSNIQKNRNRLEQLKGQKTQIESDIKDTQNSLKELGREIKNTEEAQAVLQTVAKQTQEKLEYHISEGVTLALESVFDDPYEFKVNFVAKNNRTVAELFFTKNGKEIDPLTASGCGAVDVASFALRVALWNLKKPKSRNIIILDEPFRFLSFDLQPKAGEMVKLISDKLKIQFIIVTHNQSLIDCADKLFTVKQKKGVSYVN